MKIPVQTAFILSVVVTMAIAGCQKQIAAENRQQKEKPEHSTAIEQGKKPRYKKNVKRNDLIENGVFIQIPGPNPIITPGPDGAWDDGVTEAADAFKDVDTYYFYYHATGAGKGYRLGVASSTHPLGPFKKHGDIAAAEVPLTFPAAYNRILNNVSPAAAVFTRRQRR